MSANSFSSQPSLGMSHSLTCSSYNLLSPLIMLLPLQPPSVVNMFPFCIPISAEPRGKVSSLFLSVTLYHSFPDTQTLTLMPSNYTTHFPSVFQSSANFPGSFSSFLEHLLAPSFTVSFVSVIILGDNQCPCRAVPLKVSSGLGLLPV